MRKKILVIIVAVLLCALVFTGCFEEKDKTNETYSQMILGTWVHYPDPTAGEGAGITKYTFHSNNSAYFGLILWDYESGTWMDYEITDEKLIFNFEVNNSDYSYNYMLLFSENGKELILPISIGGYLTNFTKRYDEYPLSCIYLQNFNDDVSGTINISRATGTFYDDLYHTKSGFSNYILGYGKGKDPTEWNKIIDSTELVNDTILGTLNTTTLEDGYYTLRLMVTCNLCTFIDTEHFTINNKYNYFTVDNSIANKGNFSTIQDALNNSGDG